MFYNLTVRFRNTAGIATTQTFPFQHYESAYAFTSRRAQELLEANPCWKFDGDLEHRNYDKGTYSRDVTLTDGSGNAKAVLHIEGEYFLDSLVEDFPERYSEDDFPIRDSRDTENEN